MFVKHKMSVFSAGAASIVILPSFLKLAKTDRLAKSLSALVIFANTFPSLLNKYGGSASAPNGTRFMSFVVRNFTAAALFVG